MDSPNVYADTRMSLGKPEIRPFTKDSHATSMAIFWSDDARSHFVISNILWSQWVAMARAIVTYEEEPELLPKSP